MPNTRSSKKAARQSERRSKRNIARMRSISEKEKEIRKLIAAGDIQKAHAAFREFQKFVDKAAKSFLHKNTASRMKRRIARSLLKPRG